MFQEPDDIDPAQLAAFVSGSWGLQINSLTYEPVGFGTHHYKGTDTEGNRWFVNVDELEPAPGTSIEEEFDALDRRLRTAAALKRADLEFVHAPAGKPDGSILERFDEDYAVSVYSFLDGESSPFGPYTDEDLRRQVLNAIGRMHAATDQIPPDLPLRDDLEVDERSQFFEALDEVDRPWTAGPFAEPTRKLLIKDEARIRKLFDTYDEMKAEVPQTKWVVTHGEPHAANILRTGDESFVLIDWDTVTIGPRERDLWMLQPKDGDWSDYATSGTTEVDPAALRLFDLRWALTEITTYTVWFHGPHEDDKDTSFAFPTFAHYLTSAGE